MTTIYPPSPISLPPDLGLRRIISDSNKFDDATLYYDVFYRRDGSAIIALGPRLLNLEEALFPLKILSGDRALRYRHLRFPGADVLSIEPPEPLQGSASTALTFRFKAFEQRVEIPRNPLFGDADERDRVTLVAHQKDNPLQWIVDWARWHHRLHGVTRLVLYDNGSSEYTNSELAQALDCIEEPMEKIAIPWNYPFFAFLLASNRRERYQRPQCKSGALNHCYLMLGQLGWLLNLDIDEYLVGPVALGSHVRPINRNVLYFPQKIMANIPIRDGVPTESRFLDYRYRYRYDRDRSPVKYACRCGNRFLLGIHRLQRMQWPKPVRAVARRLYLLYWRILRRHHTPFSIYHFHPLTTGWKVPHRLVVQRVEDFGADEIVMDDTVLRQAILHGLTDLE